nr:hypothetical protein [Bacteroidota bacterium]
MKNSTPPRLRLAYLKSAAWIIFLVLGFTQKIQAQDWIPFNAMDADEPVCKVLNSDCDSVVFNVQIPGMYEEYVDSLQRIWIQGFSAMDSSGCPELPVLNYLIAIPDCDSVNLGFVLNDSIILSNRYIYSAPEMIEDTAQGGGYVYLAEQFTYNTSCYTTDTLYPGYVTELTGKGAFRTQNCIRVLLYPVQYNPVEDQLKIYPDIDVKLTFYNSSGTINENLGIFNEIAGNAMINYQSDGMNASINTAIYNDTIGSWQWIDTFPNGHLGVPCDYLLITHKDFYDDTIARNKINQLAQHRAFFNGLMW